jgi:ABC-type glycerol-3-phosphate transport system substrate-binding protein
MKRFAMLAAATASLVLLALGAANRFAAPHSVIHVVTILWKEDSTPEQQQAAIDGVRKMAAEIPGVKNVWTKAIKVQGRGAPAKDGKPGRAYDTAFVIEFADQAAADRYVDHPAHLEWNKTYLPIREESTSHQITN